jgi:histone H3/H4
MKEIAQDFASNIRFQRIVVDALQKAAETMLVE